MKSGDVSEEIFFLRRDDKVNLQAQLREIIITAIIADQILPGAQLPSTRRLARHLDISRMTVTLAYQELTAQGYLEPVARSGFRVAERGGTLHAPNDTSPSASSTVGWQKRLQSVVSVHRPVAKPADWRRYPYPFVYGQTDMSLFSHAAWRDCARQALGRRDFEELAGDAAAADDVMLVNYICSRTLPMRGIRATPDEVLVTVGAQNALWIVIQLLLGEGRYAAHENPCHPDLAGALSLSHAMVTAVDVDADGLPPAALPDKLDVVFVTPSHQAPTTVTMPLARRRQLLAAADARGFIIVEDDYEFEMSFLGPPSPAFKALDRQGRVLYVGSFSKSLFPGLRLGYLVAPAEVICEARALRALMLRHPPGHLQRTVAYFLAFGHYDALIRKMRAAYHERYTIMRETLERDGLHVVGTSRFGGSGLWIEGPPWLDSDKLAAALRNDGVIIEPGAPFFKSSGRGCRFFRLGFSSIPASRVADGITHITRRLNELAKTH